MQESSRVTILVKALPQPSKRYGETVCCAGVTAQHEWKRLYPVRFRHLKGGFSRWDWVRFEYRRPTSDARRESCHVHEESLKVEGALAPRERGAFLNRMVLGSAKDAMALGHSLALIRPRKARFIVKPKSQTMIDDERDAYVRAARQGSFFDEDLATLDPSPFEFRFEFEDDGGRHDYESGDWETHAMFWRERRRTSEAEALSWMQVTFNEEYPKSGIVFAIGNQAKRPQTWQLLGVLRLDETAQGELAL